LPGLCFPVSRGCLGRSPADMVAQRGDGLVQIMQVGGSGCRVAMLPILLSSCAGEPQAHDSFQCTPVLSKAT
jgi:hypothetical protein